MERSEALGWHNPADPGMARRMLRSTLGAALARGRAMMPLRPEG